MPGTLTPSTWYPPTPFLCTVRYAHTSTWYHIPPPGIIVYRYPFLLVSPYALPMRCPVCRCFDVVSTYHIPSYALPMHYPVRR